MFRGPFLNLMRYLNKQRKTFLAFVSLKSRMEERAAGETQICFYDGSVNHSHIQFTCKRAICKKRTLHEYFMIAFVIIFQLPLSQGWSKDVTVVRAYPLPFYHCGPVSSPHDDAIFRLSFVVGFLLCFERFFSEYSGFRLSSKINISKF